MEDNSGSDNGSPEELEVVGEFEFNEEEDDMKFESVNISDDSDEGDDESFEILLRNNKSHTAAANVQKADQPVENASEQLIENEDSFVRAFFTQERLHDTLKCFLAEFYRLETTGQLDRSQISKIPIMYMTYYDLDKKQRKLLNDVNRLKDGATQVQNTWAQLKVKRNQFKREHMRVTLWKQELLNKISRYTNIIQNQHEGMPVLEDLNAKIEAADKDRMLLELEVQRLSQLHNNLLAAQPKPEVEPPKKKEEPPPKEIITPKQILPEIKPDSLNEYANASKPSLDQLTHRVILRAHPDIPVDCVAIHPVKKIYATGGDDGIWHLWSAENNELLISGKGHESWISTMAFHPGGAHIATGSADSTVRVWDFYQSKCSLILNGHSDVVWGTDFHKGGRVLASCGSDSTIRLWDLQGGAQVSMLRGHHRDINAVKWMPHSNLLVSGGADHLVGLWDAREGAMVNRGIGHEGAVFDVAPALCGNIFAAVDGCGGLKVWDIRKMQPTFETNCGNVILNGCAFDYSGNFVFTAGDDGKAQVFALEQIAKSKKDEEEEHKERLRNQEKRKRLPFSERPMSEPQKIVKLREASSWALSSFDQPCLSIAINTAANMIVCSCADGSVAICTVSTGG